MLRFERFVGESERRPITTENRLDDLKAFAERVDASNGDKPTPRKITPTDPSVPTFVVLRKISGKTDTSDHPAYAARWPLSRAI